MKEKIKVRIQRVSDRIGLVAIIYRRIESDTKNVDMEVLAHNGKWREKSPYEVIFEDEKFDVEEA